MFLVDKIETTNWNLKKKNQNVTIFCKINRIKMVHRRFVANRTKLFTVK